MFGSSPGMTRRASVAASKARHRTQLRLPAARFARVVENISLRHGGSRECRVRAAPAVSCAKLCKETHTSIQVQRRQSGIPCAMALRLMLCSPRRRIRLVTVVGGLKVLSRPVGLTPHVQWTGGLHNWIKGHCSKVHRPIAHRLCVPLRMK